MPEYPLDLGKSLGCGNPDAWPVNPSLPCEKHYPTLHLDGVEDLPEDGTMTVTFHRKEETCRTADGKEECWTCLEIKEILSVVSDKAGSDAEIEAEKNPGDRLDKMLAEVESESEDAGEMGEE